METNKVASSDAWKQRKIRNKKAECNSDLILLSMVVGVQHRFHKTKRSSYAKKVYVADDVYFKHIFTQTQILELSVMFECVVRKLWQRARRQSAIDLVITKTLFGQVLNEVGMKDFIKSKIEILADDTRIMKCDSLWNDTPLTFVNKPNNSRTEEFLKKRKMWNREASFSSFLSYILLQQGFSLTCQVSSQKATTKTLNFYLWKRYTFPSGKVVNSFDLDSVSRKLRNHLKREFSEKLTISLSQESLGVIGLTKHESDLIGYARRNIEKSIFTNPDSAENAELVEKTINTFGNGDVLHSLGF
ncbi:hypothetical protein QTN25_009395 [Entamoeba marina]